MTISYANRGQAFENLLDYTNQIYKNKGIALINKRPTPVKIIRMRGRRITSAVHDQKSTVDYDGIYKGRAIAFEAKTTKEPRFRLNLVTNHQVRYLNKADKQGAISFLIVEMRSIGKVFIVTNAILQEYLKGAKKGGRKSIPMDELKQMPEVKAGNGIPLDYIKAVEEVMEI